MSKYSEECVYKLLESKKLEKEESHGVLNNYSHFGEDIKWPGEFINLRNVFQLCGKSYKILHSFN